LDRAPAERRDLGDAGGQPRRLVRPVSSGLRRLLAAGAKHDLRGRQGEHRPADGGATAGAKGRRPGGHAHPAAGQRRRLVADPAQPGAAVRLQPREGLPRLRQQPTDRPTVPTSASATSSRPATGWSEWRSWWRPAAA
jgi:hypothetical protein